MIFFVTAFFSFEQLAVFDLQKNSPQFQIVEAGELINQLSVQTAWARSIKFEANLLQKAQISLTFAQDKPVMTIERD